MSHMKRTQIYHARDHNEENPLGSVAVTKHEEGSRVHLQHWSGPFKA